MQRLIPILLALAMSTPVYAAVVPCVQEDAADEWQIKKGSQCVQYTLEEGKALAVKVQAAKGCKAEVANLAKQRAKQEDRILLWKARKALWDETRKVLDEQVRLASQRAALWQTTAKDLAQVRSGSWTRSPVLWFVVGTVVATGAIVAGAQLTKVVK